MRGRRVGVLGGTFDPVHVGHLASAQEAAHLLALDEVLFVPNGKPPHKQGQTVSEVSHRVAMVDLAVNDNPLFSLSLVEVERQGMSYMIDTLHLLQETLDSSTELVPLVGCDALPDLHTWHQPQLLIQQFRLAVMDRPIDRSVDWADVEAHFPGIQSRVDRVPVVQLEISAASIRRRIANGQPVRYLVTDPVLQYISRHGLYQPEGKR